ncbi:branched-chain amino acid ABC transporter permease [Mycolicibacterium goodii]|uniref:Branched-chain amino acid ABC transporter permease n=1 Tax=Mycolicibacterium goodii TaxID=134601 RepID=A0ABS6HII3_MYCGD|nr:branched-chain amino acid ABC transporter permease [Mycolicibacterium goodii]OKH65911.1 amino acid ABC transporter permease [Mycobacterium sp. SWH-M5]MBU8809377.1 branched-chain amino acid ABC transporter permease [Mycolicibacterium goodii]MBU8816584.1 branched-chain amino acid ABC transporter permease [Mycolicibacterium goodii]MBU8821725.1 branched-chain amino acid ABC transporter permease [Mycolicibacterium goodii]MBU8831697.1 branched-chain amino acid ABC transporter permease [Mycoliciba
MDSTVVFQTVILGVLLGGQYALLASGLTLYFGVMRVVMLAHASFLVLAAYLAWWFTTSTGLDPMLSMAITVPLFFGLGVVMQRILLSRLRPATLTMMSCLLTLAIALVVEGVLGFLFTGVQRRVQVGYGSAQLNFFGASIPVVKLVSFGLAVFGLAALYFILMKSSFGRSLRATIQHKQAAQLVGINTDRVAGYGFGLGLATAAVGGTALALDATIFPSLHWYWIGPLMAIIVVGGLGSVPGAAIAAMILGIATSVLQIPMGATWAQTVFYLALFATLLFRPQGFFGGRLAQRF